MQPRPLPFTSVPITEVTGHCPEDPGFFQPTSAPDSFLPSPKQWGAATQLPDPAQRNAFPTSHQHDPSGKGESTVWGCWEMTMPNGISQRRFTGREPCVWGVSPISRDCTREDGESSSGGWLPCYGLLADCLLQLFAVIAAWHMAGHKEIILLRGCLTDLLK